MELPGAGGKPEGGEELKEREIQWARNAWTLSLLRAPPY